jgi:DNA repair protein RecO (recombination protein O)
MSTRTPAQRRDDVPAFVLHARPYRETSLIVEAFTADHGRVAMVARGAKRARSEMRGLLQAFQPLLLSWYGQAELKTLARAEWRGGMPLPRGSALMCGFYLNELLLKLLAREDPHPRLYAAYEQALAQLAGGAEQATLLRRFELSLLAELGYAPMLVREADTGAPLDPAADYRYAFDRGPQRAELGSDLRDEALPAEPRVHAHQQDQIAQLEHVIVRQGIVHKQALLAARDKTGRVQLLQLLRRVGQRESGTLHQLANRRFPPLQRLQQ